MTHSAAYRRAEAKIEEAQRTGAIELDLTGMNLTSLPETLGSSHAATNAEALEQPTDGIARMARQPDTVAGTTSLEQPTDHIAGMVGQFYTIAGAVSLRQPTARATKVAEQSDTIAGTVLLPQPTG